MTKEEIMTGNKTMAEYLGYVYYPHTKPYGRDNVVGWLKPKMSPKNPHFYLCRSHRDLPFYNSWDALMRVVDKIESGSVSVGISPMSVAVHNGVTAYAFERGFDDKLKATWRVCLKYINRNDRRREN
jgi:hypothetical protein